MKKKVLFFLYCLVDPFFRLGFFLYLKLKKPAKIWVVDIDNTIADTWPSLRPEHRHIPTSRRLRGLKVLEGMRRKISETDASVVFLTARKYHYFFITRKWLRENGFPVSFLNLVLVLSPEQKLHYLKKVAGSYDVSYFDDMSYNHEHGEVKFYSDCIEAIKQLPIAYYDYHYLSQINAAENDQKD